MIFSQAIWATLALCRREFLRFIRQRSRLVGAIASPLIFWLMLGLGIDDSSNSAAVGAAGNFKQFFIPGMMVMGVLFTAIFSAISLIEDKNSGFYQGVLVSPLPTWSIVLSKILGASVIAVFQGILLLPIAFLNGLRPDLCAFASIILLFFFIGFFIASLALHFGWKIESVAGFHGIMNTVLMPMWFLSGATFPIKSGVLYYVSRANPLTYAMDAFHQILFQNSYQGFLLGLSVLALSSAILFALNLRRR